MAEENSDQALLRTTFLITMGGAAAFIAVVFIFILS